VFFTAEGSPSSLLHIENSFWRAADCHKTWKRRWRGGH